MTLDQWFDAGMLPDLRRAVLAEAVAAGMPDDRANDVVLALHELAANAVLHGGGTGRLRMQAAFGELHCHVSDVGWADADPRARIVNAVAVRQWVIRPSHGLWLVRDLADHLSMTPGPAGSEVTAVFTLPGFRGVHAVR